MVTDKRLKYNWAKVAHFLLEAFAAHDFHASELRIIQLICRETYGRTVARDNPTKREYASISISEIVRRTGMPEPTIRRSIQQLVHKRVLLRNKPDRSDMPWPVGINTKIRQWKVPCQGQILEEKYPTEWTPETTSEVLITHDQYTPPHTDHPRSGVLITGDQGGGSPVISTSERNPSNHNGLRSPKEPYKEPIPKKAREGEGIVVLTAERREHPAVLLARDMFANITRAWYPITGAPRTMLSHCQRYAHDYRHNVHEAWVAFDEAYTALLDWQDQTGKTVRSPERVVNQAADILRQRGIEPQPRGEPT